MKPQSLWIALVAAWVGSLGIGIGQEVEGEFPSIQQRLPGLSRVHSQRMERLRSTGGDASGPAGGGSLANYSELMNLIENVIDAPWSNQGGSATMFPFRNGVRIDPRGLIERLDESSGARLSGLRLGKDRLNRSEPVIRLDGLGSWQEASRLRWVSLHELDSQLAACHAQEKSANIAMELLGGLCRIDFVAYDSASEEWLLGGPAGDIAANLQGDLLHRELRLPPVLLEDLLTIAPHVLNGRGELGCSIEPVQERLIAAYKMAQSPRSLRDLRSDPGHWAEEWKNELGHQRAVLIGLPPDSPTGFALLVADAHMKRIALGLEPSVDGLNNYWLEADSLSQANKGPMVRWWFTLSESRIPWDAECRIAHLAESNVRVLSESQMLDAKGDRVATERPDWAADAFAKSFTSKFPTLQRSHAIYGRLRHIFDLTVAMEIVRTQIQAGHGKPFQCLHRLDLQPHLPVAPIAIDSVVATRRSSDGSVAAIVSGGVSMVPKSIASRVERTPRRVSARITESSPGVRSREDVDADMPFWR